MSEAVVARAACGTACYKHNRRMNGPNTVDDTRRVPRLSRETPLPGLVVIFSGRETLVRAIPVPTSGVVLGRDVAGGLALADQRASRAHLRARLRNDRILVEDLGSRNGTFVDGIQVAPDVPRVVERVVRMGHTVLVASSDLRPFTSGIGTLGDTVVGPSLRAALGQLEVAARNGGDAIILGESGTGKEHAARHFHRACELAGPLVAVNCAAIPTGVAERLLFGARKGAFSGASSDAEGYFEAAQGGVLFLDELAELELDVQAKLLRVLQARELLPLGASRPHKIDVRVVAATNRDIGSLIARARFREDLWYRLAEHAVVLPPLRNRLEEIPFLIERFIGETEAAALPAHAGLVEACCLRPWRGNIRELRAAIRRAAANALGRGSPCVCDEDLGALAGWPHAEQPDAAAGAWPKRGEARPALPDDGPAGPADHDELAAAPTGAPPESGPARATASASSQRPRSGSAPSPARAAPSKEELLAVLESCEFNFSRTARTLAVQRTQLYRWMQKYGIRARRGAGPD